MSRHTPCAAAVPLSDGAPLLQCRAYTHLLVTLSCPKQSACSASPLPGTTARPVIPSYLWCSSAARQSKLVSTCIIPARAGAAPYAGPPGKRMRNSTCSGAAGGAQHHGRGARERLGGRPGRRARPVDRAGRPAHAAAARAHHAAGARAATLLCCPWHLMPHALLLRLAPHSWCANQWQARLAQHMCAQMQHG